ncbi:mCG123639 [Mus musculus]|nr:mCG123639 [Mus musculus]
MPLTPALERQRLMNISEIEANLVYILSSRPSQGYKVRS